MGLMRFGTESLQLAQLANELAGNVNKDQKPDYSGHGNSGHGKSGQGAGRGKF